MAKIGAAILVLAGLLGARGAAREIRAAFEGLDRLAQVRTSPAPEPADVTDFGYEIPPISSEVPESVTETMAALIEDAPDKLEWDLWKERAIASLPVELRENSDHRQAIEALYLQSVGTLVEKFESDISYSRGSEGSFTLHNVRIRFVEEQAAAADNSTEKSVWDRWREQAIAALPEDLRHDSDQRRAIDWLYVSAAEESLDEYSVDIINRPPIGGYDFGGVGFTDIDEQAEVRTGFLKSEQAEREVYDLRAQPQKPVDWSAFLEVWKAEAIAALPEAERNDPNRLKEIDTTVGLVRIYQPKAQVATK